MYRSRACSRITAAQDQMHPTDTHHTVPVTLAAQLVELVGRWHIPPQELLEGSGITEKTIDDPLGRLPLGVMTRLLERARLLTGEPGLGYYLGVHTAVSLYGYLGFAASAAPTLGEVLRLAVQFGPVFSTTLSLGFRIEGHAAYVHLEENVDLGPARDIVLISMLVGFRTIASALTGRAQQGSADLAIPEPPYASRFAHLGEVRYGQPVNRLVLDASVLQTPVVTADPLSARLARGLCERALAEMGFDATLVDRVRGGIEREDGSFRSLEDVAELLHVSNRTFKRRLSAQGVSFSELVDRQRRLRALALLESSRLSVEEIARRLDYSTASTFVRAFRRWTNTTPTAYRRDRVGPTTG
jgi:AraC-like DNA-binding protein